MDSRQTNIFDRLTNRLNLEIWARSYPWYKLQLDYNDLRFTPRKGKLKIFKNSKGKQVDVEKALNDLLINGFAVIEDLYANDWVDKSYENVVEYVKEFKKGKIKESSLWQKDFGYDKNLLETGIVRFYNIDEKIPQAKEFAENKLLKYLGELYYQKQMWLQTVISQYNEVSKIPCRGYHVDSYVNQFKTFIYLNDVSFNNGPHTYMKGSHKNTDNIVRKLHQCIKDEVTGRNKKVDSTGVSDKDARQMGFEEVLITGKKGTVLLVDTRGLHQGGTLKKGHRVVFNTYYYVDN